MRYDIRFSGSGGQGIITAGIILAQAAAIKAGKNAVQSQSYGPEARGGASKAEVITYNKYAVDLKDNAVIIVDNTLVHEYKQDGHTIYKVPITSSVKELLGSAVSANIATLGVLNEICKILEHDWLLEVIVGNFPERAAESNTKAYNLGVELAKKAMG